MWENSAEVDPYVTFAIFPKPLGLWLLMDETVEVLTCA